MVQSPKRKLQIDTIATELRTAYGLVGAIGSTQGQAAGRIFQTTIEELVAYCDEYSVPATALLAGMRESLKAAEQVEAPF